MEEIGQRLRRLRKDRGWTQAVLAGKAGVTQGTIGNIEGGHRGYGISLLGIARALEVEPEFLEGGPASGNRKGQPAKPASLAAGTADSEWPFTRVSLEKLRSLAGSDAKAMENAILAAAGDFDIDVRVTNPAKRLAA